MVNASRERSALCPSISSVSSGAGSVRDCVRRMADRGSCPLICDAPRRHISGRKMFNQPLLKYREQPVYLGIFSPGKEGLMPANSQVERDNFVAGSKNTDLRFDILLHGAFPFYSLTAQYIFLYIIHLYIHTSPFSLLPARRFRAPASRPRQKP